MTQNKIAKTLCIYRIEHVMRNEIRLISQAID